MDKAETSLKAAIIGLGIGERHIAGYESDPRCKVTTLCDINSEKLSEVGKRYPECRLVTNALTVLEDPSIDVVSIASYDDDHAGYVIAAIEAGKHVFVEKPICIHDDEFERIDQGLLNNPSIQLSSNLVLRKSPQFLAVKKEITDGQMGDLYYIEGDYNYGRLHKLTEGWRGKIPFYSVVHGGAIHIIDLILWLSKGKVTEVMALGNQIASRNSAFRYPDMVTIMLKFEEGFTAKVSANFGCVCPHHHTLSVFGTKASFIHNYQGGVFYHSRDPHEAVTKINLKFDTIDKGNVQRSFVSQILDKKIAEVSISDVMNTMAVSLAAERALNSGKWETVNYASVSSFKN